MLDHQHVFLGIAPIGWTNDDMPELGAENTFEQCVSEMALAGFSGTEIGNKYPKDAAVLKHKLAVRGMRVASRWFSSFLITKPLEENIKAFEAELAFLAAVGAKAINVSEQSHSVQGMEKTPIWLATKLGVSSARTTPLPSREVSQVSRPSSLAGSVSRVAMISTSGM